MSSKYNAGRDAFGRGEILWLRTGGSTVKVQGVDLDLYAADVTLDASLADIPGAARIGEAATLTLRDIDRGVCDAEDLELLADTVGEDIDGLVLYKDTGIENTSTLIVLIDAGLGLPLVTNGLPITLAWSNGPNGIFRL